MGMQTLEAAGYWWSESSPVDVPSRTIIEDYRIYAAAHGFAFRERQFCIQLGRLLPPGFGSAPVRSKSPELPSVHRAYRFPPLHQARTTFTEKTGLLFNDSEALPPDDPATE
ncbi:hypothetical protein HHL26_23740 [Sphingobium sp. TB-6]|uniref:hypothetical protein n=1 Tax=Sphingobium sp. TB-6 TaxID=2728850 RepID=UPI00146DC2D8|nr:hypothetical protein [Sphingobium sp. TB-6]NML92015.1 hypothetical protein [Sphingobium sp. TB-6]